MFDGTLDLRVGFPLAGLLGAPEAGSFLKSALDEVGSGIVVLGEDFDAEFINQAFYDMWALSPSPDGAIYNLADIVEHGRRTGLFLADPASSEDYARLRKGRLRLADGRVLRFECKRLAEGRRMMTFTDITHFVHTADRLRDLATTDELTGLPNRRQFIQVLEKEFALAHFDTGNLSVLMVDADNFKAINDQHGHASGDAVLRSLATRMRGVIRRTDLIGRLGGEEFAIALKDTDMLDALETAARLCREVAAVPFRIGGGEIEVTVSVGVATSQRQDDNAAEILRRADDALYAAKTDGRNRVSSGLGS